MHHFRFDVISVGASLQVTTFGKQGAVLLKRVENPSGDEPEATLESVICDLRGRLDKMPSPGAAGGEPGCVAGADIPIFPGNIVKTEQPVTLTFDRCGNAPVSNASS